MVTKKDKEEWSGDWGGGWGQCRKEEGNGPDCMRQQQNLGRLEPVPNWATGEPCASGKVTSCV